MTAKLNCAIIGAGIAGASAAYALLMRGANVQLFEQYDLRHDRGSSHGPTRLFRLAYFEHPDYVPLLRQAISLWRAMESEAPEKLFHQIGVFMIGAPNGNLIKGMRRGAFEHDITIEDLTRQEAAKRYPHFRQPDGYDAVFEPEAGFIRADRVLNHLFAKITEMGGTIRPRTNVTDWSVSDKCVELATKDGRETFDRLIITPGAWGNDLLRLDVPIKPLRKTLFWIAPGDKSYLFGSNFPPFAIDREDGRFFYGFPAIDGDGVKLGEHTGGTVLESATDPTQPPPDEAAGVKEFLREIMPDAPQDFSNAKQCLYETSPDSHFIIDAHPRDKRVCFAAGLSGHGFKFAPVIGEALADLAINGETQSAFDFLGVGRFGSP